MKMSPVMSCRLFWYKVTSNMVEQPTTYHHRYLFPIMVAAGTLNALHFYKATHSITHELTLMSRVSTTRTTNL